jgi:Protein of unknown function (DUF3137)
MTPSKQTSSQRPRSGRPGLSKRLKPVVRWLEQDRQKWQRQTLMLEVGIVLLVGALAWLTWTFNLEPFVYAILIAAALLAVRAVQIKAKAARSQSRNQITARFAKALGSRFMILPNGGISEADFVESHLFNGLLRSFHGSNHLRGQVGQVKLELSEIHVRTETGQRQARALFDGLWIIATFPNSFRTKTLIQPVTDDLESVQPGFRTVKLEEGAFTRLFDVRAEDSVEAQYVLSSRLLNRIKDFHDDGERDAFFAFHDQRLQIGIAQANLTGPAFAQALLEALDLTVGLVRELEANTFIWNRQSLEPRPVGPEVLEFALHTTQERNPAASPRYRNLALIGSTNPEPKTLEPKLKSTKLEPKKPEPVKPKAEKVGSAVGSTVGNTET